MNDAGTKYRQLLRDCADYRYRLEFNTFVLQSQRVLYMDTPKTAGTSIKRALAECVEQGFTEPQHSDSAESTREMFIHDRTINPVPSLFAFPEKEQAQMVFSPDWTRFCVVRNPYERLFSAWFSKILLNEVGYRDKLSGYQLPERFSVVDEIYRSFEDFVAYLHENRSFADPHWDQQVSILFLESIPWSAVLHYEQLAEQLPAVLDDAGVDAPPLQQRNVSGFNPDFGLLSPASLDQIREIYQSDFDALGYSSEPPVGGERVGDSLFSYINGVAERNARVAALTAAREPDTHRIHQLQVERDKYKPAYYHPIMAAGRFIMRCIRAGASAFGRRS